MKAVVFFSMTKKQSCKNIANEIDGDHFEFGGGLIYHFDEETDFGIFASIMNGSSCENNTSLDHSEYWSERPTDSDYYSINKYNLVSNNAYSADGKSPFLTFTFQKA